MTSIIDHTCRACGLTDWLVEDQGETYCPNPVCNGPGAEWFRMTLPSFSRLKSGHTTYNEGELYKMGIMYAKTNTSEQIQAAALRCFKKWIER